MPESRQAVRAALSAAMALVFLLLSALLYQSELRGTLSVFSDTETMAANSMSAGIFDPLMFYPGKSKAMNPHVDGTGPPPTVARIENNQFVLDFGELNAGDSHYWNDVMGIKNCGPEAVQVIFELSPEVAPYFDFVRLDGGGNTIGPETMMSVQIRISIDKKLPPGDYYGYLRVSSPGHLDKVIPVHFVVYREQLPAEPGNTPQIFPTGPAAEPDITGAGPVSGAPLPPVEPPADDNSAAMEYGPSA